MLARGLYRRVVIVDTDELRRWNALGHQDCRHAVPASDICDAPSGVELLDDTVECGQPVRHQACVVPGPEEPFGASEQARVVLSPFHACAASEVLHGPLLN